MASDTSDDADHQQHSQVVHQRDRSGDFNRSSCSLEPNASVAQSRFEQIGEVGDNERERSSSSYPEVTADELFLDDDADLDDLLDLSDEGLSPPPSTTALPEQLLPAFGTPQVSIDDVDFKRSERGSTPETSGSQAYIDPQLLLFAARKPDAAAVAAMIATSRSPSPEPEQEQQVSQTTREGQSDRDKLLFASTSAKAGAKSPSRPLTSPGTENDLYSIPLPPNQEPPKIPFATSSTSAGMGNEPQKSLSPTIRRQEAVAHLMQADVQKGKQGKDSLPPSPRLVAKHLPPLVMPHQHKPAGTESRSCRAGHGQQQLAEEERLQQRQAEERQHRRGRPSVRV